MDIRIESTEKECAILGNYFHSVVTDMKSTAPVWDDFLNKGTKLHGLLKTTAVAISSFLDSLQKIADVVTQSKGTTKDIGSVLTRLCVRQKMMEAKLKQFTNVMFECLLSPIQERLDDWKKISVQLEKDHAKEYKKATNEIKKKSNDTLRLQKKFRKGSKSDVQYQLNNMMQDVNDKFILLGEGEKAAVKNLLVEERSRVCFLSSCLKPVLEVEVSMLNEVSHLQELLNDLSRLSRDPKQLPNTEQLLADLLNGNQDVSTTLMTSSSSSGHLSNLHNSSPPSSPNTTDSRKSSMCSLNSCDSRSSSSQSHNSGSFSFHNKSVNHPQQSVTRLMSISSHDSGFGSTITNDSNGRSKPTSPTHHHKQLFQQHSMSEMPLESISPVIKSNRSMSVPGEPHSPVKMQINKKHNQHSNQYPNHTTNQDMFVLPSKPSFEPAPISPSYNNGHTGNNPDDYKKTGVCDPAFFTPPGQESTINESPPTAWDVDDLPPPPPEILREENHISDIHDLPPPPVQDDGNDKPNCVISPQSNINQNTDVINSLQRNFGRYSISQTASHNHGAALGSRSSLSSGEFLTTMTLGRKNSSNSLQYSSGYSSQHSTPACSEDTIASHDTDYGSMDGDENHHQHENGVREFEKWSTLPRPRHQPHRGSHRAPRPASTAGYPNGNMGPTIINSPGTATIKRKPSSKFSSVGRRMNAPMPVAAPVAPPVVPTVPSTPNNIHSPTKPHLRRHQSEGMFVGVNSYYYNNNNSIKPQHIPNNLHNGFSHSISCNEEAPPLPPRDDGR